MSEKNKLAGVWIYDKTPLEMNCIHRQLHCLVYKGIGNTFSPSLSSEVLIFENGNWNMPEGMRLIKWLYETNEDQGMDVLSVAVKQSPEYLELDKWHKDQRKLMEDADLERDREIQELKAQRDEFLAICKDILSNGWLYHPADMGGKLCTSYHCEDRIEEAIKKAEGGGE